jgi:hypothetical protein
MRKFSKCISIFLILFISSNAYGCMSDMQCGFGNQCVKPSDAVGLEGVCVTPTDEYGVPAPSYSMSPEPHNISGCQFDTDCNPGFSCMKRSGELDGVCLR